MQLSTAKFGLSCLALALASGGLFACSSDVSNTSESTSTSVSSKNADNVMPSVQPSYFLSDGLVEPISKVSCSLSDGSTGECYKIVTENKPSDVGMGPWCPSNISDDASKGGIWLEGGEVHDVDGEFVKNLAEFYGDSNWNMYNKTTGKIIKTSTLEDCVAAANPNVGAEYRNYCVECLPEYAADLTDTFYIPVTPKASASITEFGGPGPQARGPSVRGIAFNGVRFDAPAPVSNILGAYTLAPFDDAGGHINPHAGYHYHAATGLTTKIEQDDGHAPMIGYALDGYGIYANTDAEGNEYTDLDEARGHYDDVRGYHYHVDKAGNNNFINGLRGVYAED
ncbi:YHYH protein [Psychrobacter sp. SIMBA_152]